MNTYNTRQRWNIILLHSLAYIIKGVTYTKEDVGAAENGYIPILRANNIQNDKLDYNDLVWVIKSRISHDQFLRQGDVVVATSSGSKHLVGKAASFDGKQKISCGAFCAILRPNNLVDNLFFKYFFQTQKYRNLISSYAKGSNINNLKNGDLAKIQIPVPPLAEQKRIVKKIEELFGVIDEQVKRLEDTQGSLASYRQSILQKIFSTLPQEKPLRSIFKTSSGGTPSRRNAEFYSGNIPWVKSGELNYNTIIDTEEHLSQTALDNSSAKLFPKGSLLIALYGATIGRLAFLGVPAATNQAVCCIFPNEQYDMQFLYYFLQHKQKYLIFQSKGGAQKNISQEILKELPIPTIDLPEQKAIVKKIEMAFAFADKAQAAITNALEQAKQLKQSILKRAFEGKLVPQDPNDKPVDLTQLKKDKQK